MHRTLVSLAAALLLLAMTAQLALGAKPFMQRMVIDETFPDVVCGTSVTVHLEDQFVDIGRQAKPFIHNHVFRVTFTNAAGEWVSLSGHGHVSITETLNPDGTLTVVATDAGIPALVQASDGTKLLFDRGRVVQELVIDLGDPTDPEDDVLLAQEILFLAGPHPDLESDFALFCQVIGAQLG